MCVCVCVCVTEPGGGGWREEEGEKFKIPETEKIIEGGDEKEGSRI